MLSPVNCWYLLLNQVRRESKDHATLSDIYLNNVIMRFMQISEDSTRMFKKVPPPALSPRAPAAALPRTTLGRGWRLDYLIGPNNS